MKVIELVEDLLANVEPKPIIILQSDEGPFPKRYLDNESGFNWRQATDGELRQKMRILNAYYFPDADTSTINDGTTPVNSFRILFNTYFHADLEILPDRSFAFVSSGQLYDFFDVTAIVQ